MARNDIRCARLVEGGMTAYAINTTITGAQTFEEGEPVYVDDNGYLIECADDPAVVTGISAGTSQGMSANGEAGHLVAGTRPDGTWVQVYKPVHDQYFVCSNFATDGAGTAAVPAQTTVGDTAGFTLLGGVWYVDTGCANIHVEIVGVIDSHANFLSDIIRDVGTGVSVVFGFLT